MEAAIQTISANCNDASDGSIIIENIIGGGGAYEYSLDGEFSLRYQIFLL